MSVRHGRRILCKAHFRVDLYALPRDCSAPHIGNLEASAEGGQTLDADWATGGSVMTGREAAGLEKPQV